MTDFAQPSAFDLFRASRNILVKRVSGDITPETYVEELHKLSPPVAAREENSQPEGDINPQGYGSGSSEIRHSDSGTREQDQSNTSDLGQHPDQAKGKSQKARLLTLLQDHAPHTTIEIMAKVYRVGEDRGIARIASRINDLRNDGHNIETIRLTQTLTAYRLV